mgnify:CR=1 FL=1
MTNQDDSDLVHRVLSHLAQRHGRLVTVESCTGGMICAALTAISGASEVVEGGFVTYSNALKASAVGVPEPLIEAFGAVSIEVAEAMAQGGLMRATDATIAVSVTGIAGPGGGSEEKPVGTVCFGIAANGRISSERLHFTGDRDAIRLATLRHALEMVLAT